MRARPSADVKSSSRSPRDEELGTPRKGMGIKERRRRRRGGGREGESRESLGFKRKKELRKGKRSAADLERELCPN